MAENTIGIECRPEKSDGDVATVVDLIVDIWKRYGVLELSEHRDYVATACPGRYKASELTDMARATGCEFLMDYVRTLIDAANLRSVVRTLRMHRAGTFLQQVLFTGGAVSVERILADVNNGVAALYRATPLAAAAELGQEAVSGGSLTAFEKACDNAVLARAAASRSVPFGPEVPIGYVVARENDFTSARIILTGRQAGLDADTIRERLRDSYV